MVRSMTGYGRSEYSHDDRKFMVEIKSVNHRYNDISIKLPRSMNYMEDKVRKVLLENIFRGKTDVYIFFESNSKDDVCVNLNLPLADAYFEKIKILSERYSLKDDEMLSNIIKFSDVITVEKPDSDEETMWDILVLPLNEAIDKFIKMREVEGEVLKLDILKKVENIKIFIKNIKERSPYVPKEYEQKLNERLNVLLEKIEIDPQRVAQEIAIFADKCCIDEEITRLESHILQLVQILNDGGTIGRKLDFLIQEMNRESNTIASKSNDIIITKASIELKSEIEKIREQIQNIE